MASGDEMRERESNSIPQMDRYWHGSCCSMLDWFPKLRQWPSSSSFCPTSHPTGRYLDREEEEHNLWNAMKIQLETRVQRKWGTIRCASGWKSVTFSFFFWIEWSTEDSLLSTASCHPTSSLSPQLFSHDSRYFHSLVDRHFSSCHWNGRVRFSHSLKYRPESGFYGAQEE